MRLIDGSTTIVQTQISRHFFTELESLRGLAALLVVLFHISWMHSLYELRIIRNGSLMVDFFFVLSGFVIYHSHRGRVTNFKQFLQFIVLRIGRLYPIHLTFLMVFLVFELAKYIAVTKFDIPSENPVFSINSIQAFLANIFLLQSFGIHSATFNGPSWSISAEFYTYIILAILLMITRKVFWLVVFSFIILFLSSSLIISETLSCGFVQCVASFFSGVLAYQLYHRIATLPGNKLYNSIVFDITIAIVFSMIIVTLSLPKLWCSDTIAILLFGVFIVLLTLNPKSFMSRGLNTKFLVWIGTISYSIYMSHMSILWVYTQLMRLVFKLPVRKFDNTNSITLSDPTLGLLLVFLAILTILLVSHFTFTYIEQPCRQRFRKISGYRQKNAIKQHQHVSKQRLFSHGR
jgi:peptidoglycan/LPS O-acetylase OafA/YrhL